MIVSNVTQVTHHHIHLFHKLIMHLMENKNPFPPPESRWFPWVTFNIQPDDRRGIFLSNKTFSTKLNVIYLYLVRPILSLEPFPS